MCNVSPSVVVAGSVVYSIASGNGQGKFAVDANTGVLTLSGSLDYEATPTYQLVVRAVDRDPVSPRTGSATVDITVTDVNDMTPSCSPALQTIEVLEVTAANANIGTVACSDGDSGAAGTVSYSIVSVNSVATNTPFAIDPSTGLLSLATATLDYESVKLMTVIVHAIDGGGLTGTATINVVITNHNEFSPVFQSTPYAQTVPETTAIGSNVFVVTATDGDEGDTVTYSLNPTSAVFQIDPTTGIIYTKALLDFESASAYSLTVRATDSAGQSSNAGVTITVTNANDVKPVFNPAVYLGTVNENDNVGVIVTTVTATDTDTATVALTYSIVSGNTNGVFRVETSGNIVLDDKTTLDYDSATKSYTLVVRCSDGANTATATVAIAVTNYNDNTPSFATTSSSVNVAENAAQGFPIVTVAATDADSGSDGEIRYSITAGNAAGLFAVNPTTGAVTLVGQLNVEATSTYVLTVTATDGGTNPGGSYITHLHCIL